MLVSMIRPQIHDRFRVDCEGHRLFHWVELGFLGNVPLNTVEYSVGDVVNSIDRENAVDCKLEMSAIEEAVEYSLDTVFVTEVL